MTNKEKPIELEQVACEICLKEVPISEATVAEAADYVANFFGSDCYQKWQAQASQPPGPVEAPGATGG